MTGVQTCALPIFEALGTICPLDSVTILANLTDSEDEDIAETAGEAMSMAEGTLTDESDDDDFVDEDDEDEDDEGPRSGNHESIH